MKGLISVYEETKDLRLIGGYRPGADPDLDMAVKQVPIIYDVLKQSPGDAAVIDAYTELANALKASLSNTNRPMPAGKR
ncbi:flagellum-specific ATP synthase [compost metagenome]